MSRADPQVNLDDAEIFDMLNSADGPVGQMVTELSAQAAAVAVAVVHVRPGTPSSATTGRNSNARPPGFTKSRIRPHLAWRADGTVYGGVNAPADPAIYLEDPARQMHKSYPFLTTGLWSLEGSF
jgi:hypothetical protein